MRKTFIHSFPGVLALSFAAALIGCNDPQSGSNQTVEAGAVKADDAADHGNVIARVGDQEITFDQINTMMNSSAVVGVSVPALGTPGRDTARVVVLDKVISANLLYLDALRQGLDEDPVYQQEMRDFADGMMGNLYYRTVVAGDIPISNEEIQAFYDEVMEPGTEMTDELHSQIEATLRKRKLHKRIAAERAELREDIRIEVYPDRLGPSEDGAQPDDAVVAKYGDEILTWGDVKPVLTAAGKGATELDPLAMEADAQLAALQTIIDKRILAARAREAGLQDNPLYRSRLDEYRKTRLINLHRARLARQMEPSEEQLKQYYEDHRYEIMEVEKRKIQEVLVDTRELAETLIDRIEGGEITMFQAAKDYSIAPGAKQHLGEVGWVAQGRAQPALDELIFELEPEAIGGPVESTEGWHLFRVLDVADAKFDELGDEETRKLTRRKYIHDQLDRYVQDLRRNKFTVEVYEDNLIRLAQAEADMVAELTARATQPGSRTEQRIEELNELIGQ